MAFTSTLYTVGGNELLWIPCLYSAECLSTTCICQNILRIVMLRLIHYAEAVKHYPFQIYQTPWKSLDPTQSNGEKETCLQFFVLKKQPFDIWKHIPLSTPYLYSQLIHKLSQFLLLARLTITTSLNKSKTRVGIFCKDFKSFSEHHIASIMVKPDTNTNLMISAIWRVSISFCSRKRSRCLLAYPLCESMAWYKKKDTFK